MFFGWFRKKRLVSRRTGMYLSILLIIIVLIAQSRGWINLLPPETIPQPGTYKVVRFVDGDTLTIDMDGKSETIRMIGVDTPETHKPDTPVQCYGVAAAAYTHSLIGDQRLRLAADPKNQNRDRYGRLLRYVYLPDGRLLAAELIKNGYGFAYTAFPFSKKAEFMAYEQDARVRNAGLWGNCEVTIDGNRKQTNSVLLGEPTDHL